jgi:hypothetical protein
MATKVDFKRELRQLYGASREPQLVDVPVLNYVMMDGHGDPNTAVEYRQAVEALYAISYAAKFLVKGAPGGVDYGVLPLEGLWWTADMARFSAEDKSAWDWTMMIMQPDVVTVEIFEQALAKTAKKGLAAQAGFGWNASRREARRRSCTSVRTQPNSPRSSGCTRSSPSRVCTVAASTMRST